ncbi:2'-5' RNA ligase superfamily-domain-containing protein [Chaetomium fimeti]|uniref:polynucleotide adenylyltransferase n=1 Tax=Chaetomium fimeti TaxID=1854472 RepID=A0AAE0H9T9_9PEZI|nr:2'-5' RNA ligase superfamily-domain-containing protein [Chaetomium fimeti]
MAEPSPTPTSPQQPQPQPQPPSFTLTSHDTALALLPPPALWPRLDRLRALYDAAYPKWPPHINLVYPFVRPDRLADAADRVGAAFAPAAAAAAPLPDTGVEVCLGQVGVFERRKGVSSTIFLEDGDVARAERVKALRESVLAALGGGGAPESRPYRMHMTVAQSEDVDCDAHRFLVEKVGLLPRVEWQVAELAVLVRERDAGGGSVMRLWGRISLRDGTVERLGKVAPFYKGVGVLREVEDEDAEGAEGMAEKDQLQTASLYCAGEESERWTPFMPSKLVVASYNVLAEFEWPPSEARYPLVVKNILAENAQADVLVLEEVTDSFLSYLLSDKQIREAYPFCTHGPPHEDDIEPLPNYLNIVMLSATPLDWEYVSLHRKHKGALVAKIKHAGRSDGDRFLPVVIAAVHLSHGLTDGAVAAKKTDIKRVINYLSETYPRHPWILAGDFNVTTSSVSINTALKNKAISDLSASHLASLDGLFSEAKLVDAWQTSTEDDSDGDDVEGEQGATWDPSTNGMAAAMATGGANAQPQRYDRILVRGEGFLKITDFNMFGFLTEQGDDSKMFASDHWGVRCTLDMGGIGDKADEPSEKVADLIVPVHPEKAPEQLDQAGGVEASLRELGVIPTGDEVIKRKKALELLKGVILDAPSTDAAGSRSQPAVVIVPVGSYALDVWTASSDIDVLCIGPFSTKTFFALATQRLRKAAAQGIRILRRVLAHTGTMLEIEVDGIKVDLQYCPATLVAERWPDVLRAPATDPVWSLSVQTLAKLKAIRDTDYLARSLPDLATFRLAHRFIKTWAKSRGIYAARFGFLSGIQISILLARVHKLLARETGAPSTAETLLATFFAHYATFDWANQIAFDPTFHRHTLPYTRTAREPLAVLGYFPPARNTALTASVPSAKTLAAEFRRAGAALRDAPSWSAFVAGSTAATADFLAAHRSYVKLDVQYWGLSLARGAQFLGWLESRCVMLLVDLHRRAPGLFVRMWPARFVEANELEEGGGDRDGGGDDGDRDFRGCYLIGLDKGSPDMAKEDLKVALGALQTVLARFEAQMRGDERYFDAKSCWLSAAVVNKGELGKLELDSREWGEYTPGEEELDEEEEEEELEATSGQDSEHDEFAKKEKKKKGQAARKQIAAVDLRADKTKKFRTAADAINRIRWDPQLDSSDFVVGYEDRFTGAQEKELDAWKGEQTDEEFIPQHRILYFKRKSDDKVVWDRRTRWDELFGNGP